jgi:subtilisin family serine protease
MSDAAACIKWCAAQGARVISASFGGPSPTLTLENAIRNSGALFVTAAGNDGKNLDVNPTYPAAYPLGNILTVAATG